MERTKKVKLLNRTFDIHYVDYIENDDNNGFLFGMAHAGGNNIWIATKDVDGKRISERRQNQTLLHEIVHMILDTGQYFGSSQDEPLVEWIATSLSHILRNNKELIDEIRK